MHGALRDFYKNKKVLVTGHSGFKGAWLSQTLVNFGAQVSGISLPPETKPSLFEVLGLAKSVKNHFADIRDFDALVDIFKKEKPDIVFHLAAQAIVRNGYDEPLKTVSTNTLGTAHVLEAVKAVGTVKAAVIITTDKVYDNKEWHYAYRENDALGGYDPYSASKAAADIVANSYIQSFFNPKDFASKHNTLVAIARAGNVIGGGDWAEYRLIPDIIRAMYETKTKKITTRNPGAVRPWQHVLEPLSGYLLLAKKLYEKHTDLSGAWNFGPLHESFVTVQELIDEALKHFGEGTHEVQPDHAKHEMTQLRLDINKAHALLAWHPKLSFKETLELTFGWYRNYYENPKSIVEFTNEQINHFFN